MRLFKVIALAGLGSTLSISLAACAHRRVDPPPPPQVKVVRIKDVPPAELTACPVRPPGFPLDASATMPPAVRAAAIRLSKAFAATVDQLERLIAFDTGSPCPPIEDPHR